MQAFWWKESQTKPNLLAGRWQRLKASAGPVAGHGVERMYSSRATGIDPGDNDHDIVSDLSFGKPSKTVMRLQLQSMQAQEIGKERVVKSRECVNEFNKSQTTKSREIEKKRNKETRSEYSERVRY